MKLQKKTFASPKGEIVQYTITNDKGTEVVLSNLGAGIVAIKLPEADGSKTDVVLGYDDPEAYFADGPCAGKTPGRYANRIAKGHIEVDGKEYSLPINNGPNHLHGGPEGYQNRLWKAEEISDNSVRFSLHSPDGDCNYPGAVDATVTYTWSNDNALKIEYSAKTDAPTYINLTNHTYFNLDGHSSGTVLNHLLKMNCSTYLPTDETQIPLGAPAPVAGTPMDFTKETAIGAHIKDDFEALKIGKGYDHCYMVDGYNGTVKEVATLSSPRKGGHKLTVYSNQPAAQVYTGNWLAGCPEGKGGYTYSDYDAVAIECQGAPDAPNNDKLPSQRLNPGEEYKRVIVFELK